MNIDFHTHCDIDDPKALGEFVAQCERLNTRACLVSFGPRLDHPSCTNEQCLAMARSYPDTLVPFAFIDLWDTVDVGYITRFRDLGFKGLKCIAPYHPYDHDLYMDVYAKAERFKMPFLFHTGNLRPSSHDAVHRRPLVANMRPITIDRIARSFPNLKIVIAHLGTSLFRHEAAGMVKLHPNVYFDLAGSGQFQALTPEELANLLRNPLNPSDLGHFGKMILGSDGYITHPEVMANARGFYDALLEAVKVPAAVRENILGNTVAGWLDLLG